MGDQGLCGWFVDGGRHSWRKKLGAGNIGCRYGIDGEDQTWDVRSPPCVPGCTKPPMRPGCTPLFSEDGPIELAEWVIMWEENGKKR